MKTAIKIAKIFLTDRQMIAVKMKLNGKSNKEISIEMQIGMRSVQYLLKRGFSKLAKAKDLVD